MLVIIIVIYLTLKTYKCLFVSRKHIHLIVICGLTCLFVAKQHKCYYSYHEIFISEDIPSTSEEIILALFLFRLPSRVSSYRAQSFIIIVFYLVIVSTCFLSCILSFTRSGNFVYKKYRVSNVYLL